MKISIFVVITLLSSEATLKLLLQQPASLEVSGERGADDDYKNLISKEQLKELEYFQEEMKYNQIQNEKDDDEIYSFGLRGQQNPTILIENKKYISGFKRLMNIGSRINEFYNRFKGLVAPDQMGIQDNLKDGLNNFELTKTLTLTIVYEFSSLNSELEDMLHNLSFVDMTPIECIEFLGFKEYFTNILRTHDQTLAAFVELQHKLELRIYDFVVKGRLFLESIYAIRHFDRFMFNFFENFGKTLKKDDTSMDTEEKINTSVSIIDKSLQFKTVIADIFSGITTGLDNISSVRADIVSLLNRMNDLPKVIEESAKE